MLPGSAGLCPHVVRHPVLQLRWESVTFLHWAYEPGEVQRLLPAGLTVLEHDSAAWVGLVPFRMEVRAPGRRATPRLARFCETNVRTYVRDRAGREGVWFLSLDAGGLVAVLGARATIGARYFWAEVSLRRSGDRVEHRARRRRPGPLARSLVTVRVGPPFAPQELDVRDHFLTARWRLFSTQAGQLLHQKIQHQPWPLQRAELLGCEDELVPATGLSRPEGAPLVHHAEVVDPIWAGPPHLVR